MARAGTDQHLYRRQVKAGGGKVGKGAGDPKQWIAGAIERPGALRKKAGAKKGETIPEEKLNELAKQPGRTGKQARLAKTLKGFH